MTTPELQTFPLTDEIIAAFATELGGDFTAYRNHVCRGLNFFAALSGEVSPPPAVLIAAAFHDLGIWTHHTLDYLPPSIELAGTYLRENGLLALEPEVRAIIHEHHKVFPYKGPHAATAERFRQADLIDLSVGTFRFGLSRAFVRAVRGAFPNAGFHRRLVALTAQRLPHHPLNLLPMFHW